MYISLLLSYNIYWMKYIKEKNKVPVFGVLFNGSYEVYVEDCRQYNHKECKQTKLVLWYA